MVVTFLLTPSLHSDAHEYDIVQASRQPSQCRAVRFAQNRSRNKLEWTDNVFVILVTELPGGLSA